MNGRTRQGADIGSDRSAQRAERAMSLGRAAARTKWRNLIQSWHDPIAGALRTISGRQLAKWKKHD